MEYRIERITEKTLVGKRRRMSFTANTTAELWKSFMPERQQIMHTVSKDLYSLQMYPPLFFERFDPHAEFEKWAAIEVSNPDPIPENMELMVLPAGLYAVFFYKGPGGSAEPFQYILQTWLPESGYALDERPHFELLGENYKNHSADSEEEIWIPIKKNNL